MGYEFFLVISGSLMSHRSCLLVNAEEFKFSQFGLIFDISNTQCAASMTSLDRVSEATRIRFFGIPKMKYLLLISAVVVWVNGGTPLLAQDKSGDPPTAVSAADAKKAEALEKRKAKLVKLIEKQVAAAEKKLKLTEEQAAPVKSTLTQYYLARFKLVADFRRAADPDEKKEAKRKIRQWGNKLQKSLGEHLNEKQLKKLKSIIDSDMEALNPRPAGGGGGGAGFGDGGGGGGGGFGGGDGGGGGE